MSSFSDPFYQSVAFPSVSNDLRRTFFVLRRTIGNAFVPEIRNASSVTIECKVLRRASENKQTKSSAAAFTFRMSFSFSSLAAAARSDDFVRRQTVMLVFHFRVHLVSTCDERMPIEMNRASVWLRTLKISGHKRSEERRVGKEC